ncbi:iron-siderophore ABC transporter substrate-binding protein [Microbacterium gubbeenense]|uniref:iron-siderophore ABC transporter substrate-binding protein n=1 Tax=Microbacterium gubbeenense TaxID=159896 RepID=UPI003F9A2C0B
MSRKARMSRHRFFVAAGIAGSILALASCAGSTPAEDAAAGGGETCDATEPAPLGNDAVTIEHALGTTEIPADISRVASVGWGNQDVALALGVAPVGTDDQTWSMSGDDELGLYEWTLDAYDELCAPKPTIFEATDGVDFEAIADTAPDVILAGYSGLTEDDYATLSEIAPTVAYPDIPWYTPWRDSIRIDSEALGKADEGEQLVEDLDQQIADATADITSFEGRTAAFFYVNPTDLSTISIYATGDARTAFLGDLGFDFPELARTTSDGGGFYADIAAENADQLADVDVFVMYGDEALVQALQDDPLWGTLDAVKNGSVVVTGSGDDFSGAVTPTALSIPWMLDDYVALLDDAAQKAE